MAVKNSKSNISKNIYNKLLRYISSLFNSFVSLFTYDNQKASKVLLLIAILIEIAVATLGIYLGILLMKEGRTGLSDLAMEMSQSEIELSSLQNNFIILIYSIIALVELARVPLIISIYRGNSTIWKVTGSMIVAILMLVAFISMTIGQIKISSLRDTNIQIIDTEIGILNDDLELSKAELIDLEVLSKESIDSTYQLEIQNINNNEDKQLSQLKDRKDEIEIQKTRSSEIERGELKDLEARLAELKSDESLQIIQVNDNTSSKIRSITERQEVEIERIENNITAERERIALNQGLLNETKSWSFGEGAKGDPDANNREITDANEKIDLYETRINDIKLSLRDEIELMENDRDEKINKINQKFENDNSQVSEFIAQKKEDISLIKRQSSEELDIRVSQIDEDIKEIQSKNQSEREFTKNSYDNKLAEYENKQLQIEDKKLQIIDIKENINDLKAEKETKTSTKLVYLLATHFSFLDVCEGAETAGDVTPECRKTTENIWFGMIAGIVAIAGSAVAIGSEILRTADSRQRRKRKPIRSIFIKTLKYAFKPRTKFVDREVERIVEVPKIVTEEKVVIKEIPKEIIKKEIIHVPVPTMRDILHEDGLIKKVVKDPKKNG
ncbi:MAG: hypothetical protein CML98_05980 [Rhodobiaceae bacterium]|nr:hypothetical protein [Rhodobiaceae bacterium]|tara:strand:+ start:5474 stop:7321 length:1848 start_codon:yes stop_codon:yes gene_type:complete